MPNPFPIRPPHDLSIESHAILSTFLSDPTPTKEGIASTAATIRTVAQQATKSTIPDTTASAAKAAIARIASYQGVKSDNIITPEVVNNLVDAGSRGNYGEVGSFMVVTATWKALVALTCSSSNMAQGNVVVEGLARELRRVLDWGGEDRRNSMVRAKVGLFLARALSKVLGGMWQRNINAEKEVEVEIILACARVLAGFTAPGAEDGWRDIVGPMLDALKIVLCSKSAEDALTCAMNAVDTENNNVSDIRVGFTLLSIYLVRLALSYSAGYAPRFTKEQSPKSKELPDLEKVREHLRPRVLPYLIPKIFENIGKSGHPAFNHTLDNGLTLFEFTSECAAEAICFLATEREIAITQDTERLLMRELVSTSPVRALIASDSMLSLARHCGVTKARCLFLSVLRLSRLALASHSLASSLRLIPTAVRIASFMLRENQISQDSLFCDDSNEQVRFRDPISLRILAQLLQLHTTTETASKVLSNISIDHSSLALFIKTSLFANAHGEHIAEACLQLLPYVLDTRETCGAALAVVKRQFTTVQGFIGSVRSLSMKTIPPTYFKQVCTETVRGCRRFGAPVFPVILHFIAETAACLHISVSLEAWRDLSNILELIFQEFDELAKSSPSTAFAILCHGATAYNNLTTNASNHDKNITHPKFPPKARQVVETALSRSLAFSKDPRSLILEGERKPEEVKGISEQLHATKAVETSIQSIRKLRETCIEFTKSRLGSLKESQNNGFAAEVESLKACVNTLLLLARQGRSPKKLRNCWEHAGGKG